MHNHGPHMSGKAKNFRSSIKKLFTYDSKLFRLMIVAWISAAISSILTLIGPDKLKEITNTITAGILTGVDVENRIPLVIHIRSRGDIELRRRLRHGTCDDYLYEDFTFGCIF